MYKIRALQNLRPDAEWVIRGEKLLWLDKKTSRPTDEEINREIHRLQSIEPFLIVENQRRAAFQREADPLFFRYQRGEATEQDWLDKVEEIRERYPYPNESKEAIDDQ